MSRSVLLKMGHPRSVLRLFLVFSNEQYFFKKHNNLKHIHLVSSAGIQTHNLLNMSRLFPLRLDQGFSPGIFTNL